MPPSFISPSLLGTEHTDIMYITGVPTATEYSWFLSLKLEVPVPEDHLLPLS